MLSWRALARLFSLATRNDVRTEVMRDMARFEITTQWRLAGQGT
jgi:hypothetical protein